MPNLSLVIVSYNTCQLTLQCLESIFKNKWRYKIELWVVDNNSTDDSVVVIKKKYPQVKVIQSKINLGFAGGNNLALKQARGDYCLLLNSDTLVQPQSLDNLMDFAKENNFEIASCRVVNKDGSFQANGGELPNFLPMFFWLSGLDDLLRKIISISSYQEVDQSYYYNGKHIGWVSGSVMLVNRSVFQKIGFLDEKIFMYGEDVEFCWRARKAGFKAGWTNRAEIVHLGGGSSKSPKYNQWAGEFRGLLYIYNKYYGFFPSLCLRFLIYIFIIARAGTFMLLGRFNYTRTYAKVFTKI